MVNPRLISQERWGEAKRSNGLQSSMAAMVAVFDNASQHLIGLRENLQEPPTFAGKNQAFLQSSPKTNPLAYCENTTGIHRYSQTWSNKPGAKCHRPHGTPAPPQGP